MSEPSEGALTAAADVLHVDDHPDDAGLGKGLARRHMNLVALGGVIGAGLSVGSGVVIGQAGRAAIVSFVVAGLITVLVMRMLAEMAVDRPALGSFYIYARESLWAPRRIRGRLAVLVLLHGV
ncbi:amino acid permease [Mobilicoccus pelagius]|uniref:Gamma-aminobutyrate permease n=1 Tax=Mobilicoccus pelagius NBRC 104925 TaxID=1089455 RepID=H5UPM4_9MICO|nr:amino acid permease [Mobilicoccus pelagius]GAB47682.1 gamma-aminobutyrate permease [Mobilicoccus pelagius NBRC 104925]